MVGGAFQVLMGATGAEENPVSLVLVPDNQEHQEDLETRAHMVPRVRKESPSIFLKTE